MVNQATSAINPEEFFQAFNIDPESLTEEGKLKLGGKFLSFMISKILDDFPQVKDHLEGYIREFKKSIESSPQ